MWSPGPNNGDLSSFQMVNAFSASEVSIVAVRGYVCTLGFYMLLLLT